MKRPKINEKEAGVGPFKKQQHILTLKNGHTIGMLGNILGQGVDEV